MNKSVLGKIVRRIIQALDDAVLTEDLRPELEERIHLPRRRGIHHGAILADIIDRVRFSSCNSCCKASSDCRRKLTATRHKPFPLPPLNCEK